MNIEQLIYNKLSLQEGVNLPSLGSLRVECRAAKFVSKTAVQAPYAQVVFSKNNTSNLISVVDLMLENSALTSDECHRQYQQWLDTKQDKKHIIIDGVGEIRSDFFYPSTLLESMLNPFAGEVINNGWTAQGQNEKSESGSCPIKNKRALCWSIAVVVVGGFIALIGLTVDFSTIYNTPTPEIANVIEPEIKADTLAIEAEASIEIVDEELPSSAEDIVIISTESTTASPFHVIAGLYSNDKNADSFISSLKTQLSDTIRYEKIRRESGRILVSVYAAQSFGEASRAIEKLGNNSLWVFSR